METTRLLPVGPSLTLLEQSFNDRYSIWVREALDELPESFTISDPVISGHPIVFASRGFVKLMGYSKEEVVGNNGRLFQGRGTSRRSVMEIREAIREERGVEISLVNYRKDGTPFSMLFRMCPVFGREDGRVVHFVGVQVPIGVGGKRGSCGGGGEVVFGSCRREVGCGGGGGELGRVLALDSGCARGFEIEEQCEASDFEKQRASAAITSILSVLSHYSESTGKLVCGKRLSSTGMGALSSCVIISLGRIKQRFVLTDPNLPDMPIVYASDGFLKLTGYTRDEVLGRNCRFLSGVDTDNSVRSQIRESIQAEQPCTVRILNYRKDKSSFWNLLHISPVRNATGKVAYFVGVQVEEGGKGHDQNAALSPEREQLSVVGAVKVAIRSLSMVAATGSSQSR